jgi:hypothetical protein
MDLDCVNAAGRRKGDSIATKVWRNAASGLACAGHKRHYPHDLWGISRAFDQNKTRFNVGQYEKIIIL